MILRFRLGTLLIIIALAALIVAFFAPELRTLDRNAQAVFLIVGIGTVMFFVSFSPVWVVLFYLRKRSRRGQKIIAVLYVALLVAIISGRVPGLLQTG
jgi:hypothetical protein